VNHSILTELARALGREDFIERLPDAVLVVMSEIVTEETSGEDDTQVDDTVSGTPRRTLTKIPDVFETLAVRKKRHNEDKERITLGRERTCDIVVRTPGVSKLHAHFVPTQPLQLVDRGSQNGTFVGDRRLVASQPVAVAPGVQITFGDLVTKLVSPEELYVLLKTRRS
jgi:pSer/pThr/pTyr-binding forkhead associated (FHA) protein